MVQGRSKSPFINKKSRIPRPTLDRGGLAFVPGGSKVDRWIRDRGVGGARDWLKGRRHASSSSPGAGALAEAEFCGGAVGSSALLTGVNPDRVPAQTGGRKTL